MKKEERERRLYGSAYILMIVIGIFFLSSSAQICNDLLKGVFHGIFIVLEPGGRLFHHLFKNFDSSENLNSKP